jgi:hypothetical protein
VFKLIIKFKNKILENLANILPSGLSGVLDPTQFNYTYINSTDKSFPDVVNVNAILFNNSFDITLYKQGLWESSSIGSNVLFNNSFNPNPNNASSNNTVSLLTFTISV